uniref:Uncharacterized protein n=1 Tax=Siphoviridae sp. ct1mp9 TaxID=2826274 RepID=A0A8S5N9Q4_9CAUD|nr:MAG TPA: hypothetical protein [Siphoviridae sp. ct1mp9]
MNKRQQKKSVMRNVSKLYDMAFERNRFRKDVAIICGRGLRNARVLTTMAVKRAVYEYAPFEAVGITLEGYVVDSQVIQERGS